MCRKCVEEDDSLSPEEKAELLADFDALDRMVDQIGDDVVAALKAIQAKYAHHPDNRMYSQALSTVLAGLLGATLQRAPKEMHAHVLALSFKEIVTAMRQSNDGTPLDFSVGDVDGNVALVITVEKDEDEPKREPDLTVKVPTLH